MDTTFDTIHMLDTSQKYLVVFNFCSKIDTNWWKKIIIKIIQNIAWNGLINARD